jgi:hypothetical protein
MERTQFFDRIRKDYTTKERWLESNCRGQACKGCWYFEDKQCGKNGHPALIYTKAVLQEMNEIRGVAIGKKLK